MPSGSKIVHVEWQLVALINVPMRLLRFTVEVANRVLVESVLMVTVQDVVKPRWVCEPKDAVSRLC